MRRPHGPKDLVGPPELNSQGAFRSDEPELEMHLQGSFRCETPVEAPALTFRPGETP